jgi:hypothetical protein
MTRLHGEARKFWWLAVVSAVALAVAGCSSTSGEDSGAGGGGGAVGGGSGGGSGGGAGGGGGNDAGAADAGPNLPPPSDAGECPPQGPHGVCASNADCDDGLFCNGAETCQDGACVAGTAPACTSPQVCNEWLRACAQCATDANCNDGLFCNGVETCNVGTGTCRAPTAPGCPTTRMCNETTDRCYGCTTAADCNDGLWCNGLETCVSGACVAGPLKPCGTRPCYETEHECGCTTAAQCSDTLFCNGAELCTAGHCKPGYYPCTGSTQICNEATTSCTTGTIPQCTTDQSCTNNVFCDGVERCMPGAAGADGRGCVAGPGNPCQANQVCQEGSQRCVSNCPSPDTDGDGHRSQSCGGDDCDDSDPNRFPGNPEVCIANVQMWHDEDCDPMTFGALDADGDGYTSTACYNLDVSGTRHAGTDCVDSDSTVHPLATEVCNGKDDNCNGEIDEALLLSLHHDGDGDGAGAASCARLVCPGTPAFVANADDCDDTLAAVRAGSQACGQGGDPNVIYVCDPGGTWRQTTCSASTRCVAQPNGTALCN